MFHRSEFAEWRNMDITQELLKEIAKQATVIVETVLNSNSFDGHREQFLKGFLQGLSACSGWTPEFIKEEGDREPDALAEDQYEA